MEPRFLVDINVARLAEWLRALGYDAVLGRGADDRALARSALLEGRVLLTRDARLMELREVAKGGVSALLVRSDRHRTQLRQVVTELGLSTAGAFSRCIRCNRPMEPASWEEVRDRVPPYVYRTQQGFMSCPDCHRVYWQGSHWRNMRRELALALEET